jgi:hypothetical protein
MVKTYQAMNISESSGDAIARGSARIDTAKKILRNGWTDAVVKDHRLTDDYKRDLANNFGANKDISEDDLLEQLEEVTEPKRTWIELKSDGRQILIFYWSFMEYRAELNTSKVRFDFGDY